MPPEQRDKAYLWDMLDAARQVETFMTGVSMTNFEQDRKLQLAVERLLEIVGEASRRMSEAFRAENGQVPWTSMIGLRNVLAHEYGEVRSDIIWRVATRRVPELIQALERLMAD